MGLLLKYVSGMEYSQFWPEDALESEFRLSKITDCHLFILETEVWANVDPADSTRTAKIKAKVFMAHNVTHRNA